MIDEFEGEKLGLVDHTFPHKSFLLSIIDNILKTKRVKQHRKQTGINFLYNYENSFFLIQVNQLMKSDFLPFW